LPPRPDRRSHPPVETGGWNFGKSAFADCGAGIGVGRRGIGAATLHPRIEIRGNNGTKSAFADCGVGIGVGRRGIGAATLHPRIEIRGNNGTKSAFADCGAVTSRLCAIRSGANAAASRSLRGFPLF
jgi:hypothetical protein